MANKAQHRRTSVAGRVPAASDIAVGELAINLTDKILYTKNDAGQIIRVGAATYTKAEMDAKFLPQGILPITRVGDLTSNPLPISLSGSTLAVGSPIPVILSGRQFSVVPASVPFTPGTTAGTLYVYVTLSSGAAVLTVSNIVAPESTTNVFIGTMQVAAGGAVSSLAVSKVSRLDIYRPSVNPIGSAFPVSSGTPDTTGSINW